MEKPFVWPEEPKDWTPWGRKERDDSIRQSQVYQGVESARDQRMKAKSMRMHALKVLGGALAKGKAGPKKKDGEKKDGKEEKRAEMKGAVPASRGAKKSSKPKKIDEALIKRWEAARTTQIMGKELLGVDNYAGIRAARPSEQ